MRIMTAISTGLRSLYVNSPKLRRLVGMKERRRISAGISSNTVSRLSAMPLASTKPMSGPMPNSISASARKPTMVVAPEALIDENAERSALAIACSGCTPLAFSSEKACSRKME